MRKSALVTLSSHSADVQMTTDRGWVGGRGERGQWLVGRLAAPGSAVVALSATDNGQEAGAVRQASPSGDPPTSEALVHESVSRRRYCGVSSKRLRGVTHLFVSSSSSALPAAAGRLVEIVIEHPDGLTLAELISAAQARFAGLHARRVADLVNRAVGERTDRVGRPAVRGTGRCAGGPRRGPTGRSATAGHRR